MFVARKFCFPLSSYKQRRLHVHTNFCSANMQLKKEQTVNGNKEIFDRKRRLCTCRTAATIVNSFISNMLRAAQCASLLAYPWTQRWDHHVENKCFVWTNRIKSENDDEKLPQKKCELIEKWKKARVDAVNSSRNYQVCCCVWPLNVCEGSKSENYVESSIGSIFSSSASYVVNVNIYSFTLSNEHDIDLLFFSPSLPTSAVSNSMHNNILYVLFLLCCRFSLCMNKASNVVDLLSN